MKRRGRVFALFAATALLLLVVSSVLAAVVIHSDGQVPFYARISRGEIMNDGE